MKQTAVDFFYEGLDDIIQLYPSEWYEIQKLFEQAKQLEKEQIMEVYETRRRILDPDENGVIKLMSGEQYYNETYK